jgi:hypothetical protein
MTTKDLILQELDRLSEPALIEFLEIVRTLKEKHSVNQMRPEVWSAYLDSQREREEVYRRLADS